MNSFSMNSNRQAELQLRCAQILTLDYDTYRTSAFRFCSDSLNLYVVQFSYVDSTTISGKLYQLNLSTLDVINFVSFKLRGSRTSNELFCQLTKSRLLNSTHLSTLNVEFGKIQLSIIKYRLSKKQKFEKEQRQEHNLSDERKAGRRKDVVQKRQNDLATNQTDDELSHLVQAKTEKEKSHARLERKIFNNPAMWKFKI